MRRGRNGFLVYRTPGNVAFPRWRHGWSERGNVSGRRLPRRDGRRRSADPSPGRPDTDQARANFRPASLKKTRALLAYLVATGRAHLRERLCDLLWDTPDDPRAALRWSLAKLRPLLDEGDTARLVTDRERIGFALHKTDVDVVKLAALASGGVASATTAQLEAAAALFSGEFAESLELPACFRFHEWCTAEREKWGALRLAASGATKSAQFSTASLQPPRQRTRRPVLYCLSVILESARRGCFAIWLDRPPIWADRS